MRTRLSRNQFKLILRFVGLVLVILGTYGSEFFIHTEEYSYAIACTLFIFGGSILELIVGDQLTEHQFPSGTEDRLKSIDEYRKVVQQSIERKLKSTIENLKGCNQTVISATVHLAVEFFTSIDDTPELGFVQLMDYVGIHGGPRGRVIPAYKGIIGRCLRTRKSEFVNFATRQEYNERMVKEFGWTPDETLRRTKVARSYYATPIRDVDRIIGVLYLFSTEPQVFPKAIQGKSIEDAAKDIGLILKAGGIL